MNMQQVVQPRTLSNGHGRRKVEKDSIARPDSKGVSSESPSRDRLIYLTTCLIGHQVEVHLMDGSVITGIFHATNAEDFGIVLKMAHLMRDGSGKQKSISDSLNKPPSRTLVIPGNDLVQLIAKQGVPVTKDGLSNELPYERQQELLTDSCISQSRHIDVGRELGRWVPDENEPSFPDLENVFDSPWKRGWDQFETNATLFGVKSTFNEELYTTKLERGPQTRELEKEALRIAREIEGQDTLDLHLAEERGIQLDGNLEIDEETRFSSVYRPVDDSGYDETEDILLDSRNDETFGDTLPVISKPPMDMNPRKISDETRASSRSSSVGEVQSSVSTSRDIYHSSFEDQDQQLLNENFPKESSVIYSSRVLDNQLTGRAKYSSAQEDKYKPVSLDRGGASKAENTDLLLRLNRDSSDEVATSPKATSFDPSNASSKVEVKLSSTNELPEGALPPKAQGAANSGARPSSSASSTSDRGGPASTSATRGSSSSSAGSLSSDKSSLNPHAKEFKFNPNAKSFVPSQTSLRPSSPVSEGPFYYPAMPPMAQMHGMPVGVGIGPSFAPQQHVIYNPQAAPVPPPYYHPNGPQYGHQMMIGQQRPVLYMPYSPPEMPYKGREF